MLKILHLGLGVNLEFCNF